jgi:hypothetical protein
VNRRPFAKFCLKPKKQPVMGWRRVDDLGVWQDQSHEAYVQKAIQHLIDKKCLGGTVLDASFGEALLPLCIAMIRAQISQHLGIPYTSFCRLAATE